MSVTQWRGRQVDNTVVFLHGLCLNSSTWSDQIASTLAGFGPRTQVIAYDHRGHGDSDSASVSSYTVDRLASDLDDVLATLKVRGPVTLVGHSLGGMTALTYLSQPRRTEISGLVLVATTAGNLTSSGAGRLLTIPGIDLLASSFDRIPDVAARGFALPLCTLLRRLGSGASRRATLMATAAHALATSSPRTAAGFLPTLRDFDVTESLAHIEARTTILGGEFDALTPIEHSELLAQRIAGSTFHRLRCAGHMLPQLEPDTVAGAIADVAGLQEFAAA
ncbi:alpha/beta hydrolase [Mycobacterium koreense]|uniref:alpha/beta fold hydrolase n=1 Tax=Mycolicibacillus koreensis TaxID=1069220 RepID=UPI0013D29618|nr:alpha/beta hydrolase [Mycolicibacillus koreensis]MCV7247815.1 alpha/beta hydrolase [Mycolicibacillus koreensis]